MIWFTALFFALATGVACSSRQRIGLETAAAKALVSDEQEQQLGLQVKSELEQKQHVKYLPDPVVNSYVQSVIDRILPFAKNDRPNQKWELHVIDDLKTVNAFATPGGYIYVYSGLLVEAGNEAELAGVLAHECGHVVARHIARQMVNTYGLQAVLSLALGKNPSLLQQLAGGIAAKGTMLANSRSDETEADEYGARYASRAGYDPRGLVTFFEKLLQKQGSEPKVLSWLSDHPATADRIEHINALIAENHLTGSDLGAERLAPIKQRLSSHL
jgi:predicted Zn-dependent protease